MSVAFWVVIGWFLMTVLTAFGARTGLAHLLPDATVTTLVFIALRREPTHIVLIAIGLGYVVGRQALAPFGLHECASVLCAMTVYLAAGNLAGSGAPFFALAAGGATMFYHFTLYVLSSLFSGGAGFASWATAALLPSAVVTAAFAFLVHGLMVRIEQKLAPDGREELSWH